MGGLINNSGVADLKMDASAVVFLFDYIVSVNKTASK